MGPLEGAGSEELERRATAAEAAELQALVATGRGAGDGWRRVATVRRGRGQNSLRKAGQKPAQDRPL